MHQIATIVCLFSLLLAGLIFPQPSSVQFTNLTIDDGLSENSVICILQDRKGFLWFGTGDGLNRYDGHQFKIYKHDPDNPHSIGSNYILAVFEDHNGDLWIGTWQGGLNKYNRENDTFTRFLNDPDDPYSLSDNSALSIYQDSKGILWIGTIAGGINQYHKGDGEKSPEEYFAHYKHDPNNPNTLSNNVVTTIAEGPSGELWIGTGGGGLNRFDPETLEFSHYASNTEDTASLSHNAVTAILPDPDDSAILWIGTRGGGISRFDTRTEKFFRYMSMAENASSLSNNLIYSIYFDRKKQLWVGTFGGGLNRLDRDKSRFIHYKNDPANPQSLSDDKVISIFEDNSGNLWLGTHKGGINKLNRLASRFRHFLQGIGNESMRLCSSIITTVYEDQAGALWVGTQEGLNRFDRKGGKFIYYLHDPSRATSLSHNWVSSIFEDNRGNFWVGTYGGGLNLMDRRTGAFRHFRHDSDNANSIGDDRVLSISESGGVLWIGIRGGGLNRFDPETKTFRQYIPEPDNPNSLSNNIVRQVYPDKSGMLWLATNSGLNRFDPVTGIFSRFFHEPDNPNSLSDNRILSINEDSRGLLWISTMNGLNRFDHSTNEFTSYLEQNGLPNNVVYAVLEDNQGNLWLSTNGGLSKFDLNTEKCTNFDVRDGLQGNEFNVGAYLKSQSGEMFFGGNNGLNAFYPDSIATNSHIPQVVITDFRLLNKSIEIGDSTILQKCIWEDPEIHLSYNDKVFSFEFAALDYTAPAKNQYAYMMEGFDEDWIASGNRHFAGYTNLDPGHYRFRVKGSNNNGVWNEEGVSLNIIIAPPFWMTWWFRSMVLITIFAFMYAFYRMRLRRLLELERTRTRIARDLHDEVSATLSSISFFGQAIVNKWEKQMPAEGRTFLSAIINSAQDALEKIKDIIWAINPEHDQLDELLAKCQRFASDLFDSKEIAYAIDISPNKTSKTLGMEARQHFWLIFKEIITNVAKHSKATTIDVIISADNNRIKLVVSDDGVGFNPDILKGGNGLKNIRSRAEKLNARLNLQTLEGQGTKWEISFGI